MEITVWDHDRLHHRLIGGLRLGLGTGGTDADAAGTTGTERFETTFAPLCREELRGGRGLDGLHPRGGPVVAADAAGGRRMGGGRFTAETVKDQTQVRRFEMCQWTCGGSGAGLYTKVPKGICKMDDSCMINS